jgi:hypothetical protein
MAAGGAKSAPGKGQDTGPSLSEGQARDKAGAAAGGDRKSKTRREDLIRPPKCTRREDIS